MTKFGILMTLKSSPMPAERQPDAMKALREGFIEAGKALGCEVECKVVPMPENYDLKDLQGYFVACAL